MSKHFNEMDEEELLDYISRGKAFGCELKEFHCKLEGVYNTHVDECTVKKLILPISDHLRITLTYARGALCKLRGD